MTETEKKPIGPAGILYALKSNTFLTAPWCLSSVMTWKCSAYQFHGEIVLLPAAQHQTHVPSCSVLPQRHLPHTEEDCWLASQAQTKAIRTSCRPNWTPQSCSKMLKSSEVLEKCPEWVYHVDPEAMVELLLSQAPAGLYMPYGGGGEVSASSFSPPTLGHEGGKNKRRRQKARGAPRLLLPLWEAAKPNAPSGGGVVPPFPSSFAHGNTLCYCSSMDHWSFGEEKEKEKDSPLNLLRPFPR